MVAPRTAQRFLASSDVPARVGRYDVLAPLGVGGMASVYLARSRGSAGFERLAAVKVLHRGMCADQDFVEMFMDEARVAARLHHPNATAIIDLGAEGPQLYMVMEYVQGDTLHAVQFGASTRAEPIPLGVALRIVLDALAGLDAAHELRGADGRSLQLIHRDVTPHNVLIGVDGAARLADFGIARAASRTGITHVGVVKGKVPFMAPEHLRGLPLDRRADIFSMGVTLWETMSLRRCFPHREGAPFARLGPERYEPLADVAPHVPAALDVICSRALAADPADRFPTAAAFAEAIEAGFRRDVATQRELGRFIAEVAADKVRREREAVRLSAQPMPGRPTRSAASTPSAPVIDLRPLRAAESRALPLQRPLGDGLDDSEDVTAIAPPKQPPAAAVVTPPIRLGPPARAVDAASLYEVPTQAFALHRPRTSSDALRAVRETARPPALLAPVAPEEAEAPTRPPAPAALTVGPPRPPPPAPEPATMRPPRSLRSPPSRRPRISRAPSRVRSLAARLWRWLGR
jgi:serine/threonine-protein kinase